MTTRVDITTTGDGTWTVPPIDDTSIEVWVWGGGTDGGTGDGANGGDGAAFAKGTFTVSPDQVIDLHVATANDGSWFSSSGELYANTRFDAGGSASTATQAGGGGGSGCSGGGEEDYCAANGGGGGGAGSAGDGGDGSSATCDPGGDGCNGGSTGSSPDGIGNGGDGNSTGSQGLISIFYTPVVPLNISVFDAITVAEVKTVNRVYTANKNETVTVTDVPTIRTILNVNVNDAITVSESTSLTGAGSGTLFINKSETISVSDVNLTLIVPMVLLVSPESYLSQPALAPYDDVELRATVSYPDPAAPGPTIAMQRSTDGVNFADAGGAIPYLSTAIWHFEDGGPGAGALTPLTQYWYRAKIGLDLDSNILWGPSKQGGTYAHLSDLAESISVSESVNVAIGGGVSKNDTVSVSESVTVALSNHAVNKSDTVTITESVSVVLTTTVNLSASQNITVSESVSVLVQNYNLSVAENVAVVDAPTVSVFQPNLTIDVHEALHLDEVLTLATFDASKFDTITIGESVQIAFALEINKAETITVAESRNVAQALTIKTVENLAVVSTPTVRRSVYFVTPNAESITISESVHLTTVLTIHAVDTVSVTESATLRPALFVAVSESVVVAENVQTARTLRINVSDSVTQETATELERIIDSGLGFLGGQQGKGQTEQARPPTARRGRRPGDAYFRVTEDLPGV